MQIKEFRDLPGHGGLVEGGEYAVGIGGIMLFCPAQFLKKLGVAKFADDYRQWLGIAFIASVGLLSVAFITRVMSLGGDKRREAAFRKHLVKVLGSLTEEEKQILRFYIYHQTKTNTLRYDDGIVQGLAAKGVIHRAASVGNLVEGFAYNINEFAWKHLNENQSLLFGRTDTMRNDKFSFDGF